MRKEWIFLGGRMEEGKMDETWMARWMGLWSPGEPLIGEPSMEEREPCPSSLSCNFCLSYFIEVKEWEILSYRAELRRMGEKHYELISLVIVESGERGGEWRK